MNGMASSRHLYSHVLLLSFCVPRADLLVRKGFTSTASPVAHEWYIVGDTSCTEEEIKGNKLWHIDCRNAG